MKKTTVTTSGLLWLLLLLGFSTTPLINVSTVAADNASLMWGSTWNMTDGEESLSDSVCAAIRYHFSLTGEYAYLHDYYGEETEKISAIAWKCVYTTYAHVRIPSLQPLAGCGPPALCEIEAVHRNLQKVLLQGHSGACHQPYQQKEKNQYSFFGSNYPSQYGYPLPIEVAGIFSFFQFPGPYAAFSFRPAF